MRNKSINQKDKEVCSLCNLPKKLMKSHIFPKFIFTWLKETGTGGLRGSWNLNQRIQDGIKAPFLCTECEKAFSKAETYFSTKMFYPVVNNEAKEFKYNFNLFYFAISIFWRLLKYDVLKREEENIHYKTLVNAEKEWREYLLNGKSIQNFNRLHLLVAVDPLNPKNLEENNIIVPKRYIQYMSRMTDGDIADNDESCMMFIKLPRFIFMLPLIGFDEDKMINSRILESEGTYILDDVAILDSSIGDFFLERVKIVNEMFEEISPVQRQKMRQKWLDKEEDLLNKDLGRIIEYSKRKYPD